MHEMSLFFSTSTGIKCQYEVNPPLCGLSGQVNDTKPILYPDPANPYHYFATNTTIRYSYSNDDSSISVINQHLANISYSQPLSEHFLTNLPYGTNFITVRATDNSTNLHECTFVYERKSK